MSEATPTPEKIWMITGKTSGSRDSSVDIGGVLRGEPSAAPVTVSGEKKAVAVEKLKREMKGLLQASSLVFPVPGFELKDFDFQFLTVNERGEEVKRDQRQAQSFAEDLGNGLNLEMIAIPGGRFLMGTEDREIERLVKRFNLDGFRREKPQHEVTVQPFFMGKYPITQAQYQEVMSKNPSNFKGDERPVEYVTWDEAEEFCQRLSKQTGTEYRLPTEAEWEYACRAGTTTPFHFGETITTDLANYDGNYTYANESQGEYREQTTPVGSFSPNAFGLYDMHGQVWEWCQDNWHDNYEGAPKDGSPWLSGFSSTKIMRGGSWAYNPGVCRSACRFYLARGFCDVDIGFRVVCVAPSTT